jgi:hypothetical protein
MSNLPQQYTGSVPDYMSAQVEAMPMMRDWGGLVLSTQGKQVQAALREVVAKGAMQKAEMLLLHEFTRDAMDSTAAINEHRKNLAGDDQALNMMLAELQIGHVQELIRRQRGRGF